MRKATHRPVVSFLTCLLREPYSGDTHPTPFQTTPTEHRRSAHNELYDS